MIPALKKRDPVFLEMAEALISGMTVMMPVLEFNVWMRLISDVAYNSEGDEDKLNFWQKILYYFINVMIWSLRYKFMRIYQNAAMYVILYLMRNLPFLVYWKYGLNNSPVKIF